MKTAAILLLSLYGFVDVRYEISLKFRYR